MRSQESESSPTPRSDSPGTLRNNHNRQREIQARYQAEINHLPAHSTEIIAIFVSRSLQLTLERLYRLLLGKDITLKLCQRIKMQ